MAVENLKNVQSVSTDMRAHTVTVTIEEEETSLQEVLGALNDAGYTVPSYEQVDAES